MKTINLIIKILISALFVACQQAILILSGILLLRDGHLNFAIVLWILCLPMLYLNYQTVKMVFKYGVINFITANADTSEIDVKVEDRWYN